ncbi:dolichyl-di-phosphooligosaccharide-protein glycotransferase [Sodiomyces alkalinus F11]|uniref:Dolichyl-diphosphooligosaccharide--protein glycosyltransferase subunit WBP1 n=1 Tax=Sodiomyces alkalinus (strain CBS 110278 / VKM F-3762 / F11) TaxID=1314773 RepID=A0A3N2Q2I2_SODAK|nr:dolichyl-di-phosphooligosaccharide-protein glycotransferase [Sodiomyces alkalinus F11]ROT40947.1 dolichyl-di-phosphooligosaccharide-protein glycotransferase [Sodiomyces alkalinus F11]
MKSFLSLFVFLFAAAVHAASAGGDRLLVLLDDVAEKDVYSTFLGDLEGRGFKIDYETPKSENLHLFHLGERVYDHILFFPTKTKGLGPNLTPNILVKFINAHGNILVTNSASTTIPTSLVGLLNELDISLPAERTGLVVDHFNYDTLSADESHDVLVLPAPHPLRPGVKDIFEAGADDVLAFPSGVGHVLGSSALLNPVVRATKTAYSYNPKEQGDVVDPDDLLAAGQQLALVSTFQARNSARLSLIGSAEMLSNKWFDAKVKKLGGDKVGTWNRAFAKKISGWTFQEIGVLRVNTIEHHLAEPGVESEPNPKIYRVGNNVTYSISMSEYSWDSWAPFILPEDDDLQLEVSMLSPFLRMNLELVDKSTDASTYTRSFTLPDKHGIFNFLVNYKRPFFTSVEEKNTFTLRHMAHDEWPRSYAIVAGWPWLLGMFLTFGGFLLFCAVWMYSAPARPTTTKKTQ